MYTYNNTLYKHNKTHFSDFDPFSFYFHLLKCTLDTKSNNWQWFFESTWFKFSYR